MGPRVPWLCPSLAGPPLGVLEVEVGPAQPEAAEEVTEVTIFCQLHLNYSGLFCVTLSDTSFLVPQRLFIICVA